MNKLIPFVIALTLLAGCSRHSELHEAMEDMGGAYKAMKNLDSVAEIKAQIDAFKAAEEVAKVQKIKPEDQATFDEGMKKLNTLIASIDTALLANDIEAAKVLMEQLGEARKKYHDKLGVKKK